VLGNSSYTDHLKTILNSLLENVSLQARVHLWFLHDGSPKDFLLSVRKLLPSVFPEQWIGQVRPTFWSVRFSDLKYLIFFYLSGRLKSTVYATEASDIQDLLQQRIQNGFEMIRETHGILWPVRKSGYRRASSCVISPKWTL